MFFSPCSQLTKHKKESIASLRHRDPQKVAEKEKLKKKKKDTEHNLKVSHSFLPSILFLAASLSVFDSLLQKAKASIKP